MTKFGYTLSSEGRIIACGYVGNYDNYIDGSEPFTDFDCEFWKKDLQTNEWLYLPDITPVDKNIIDVKYDWHQNKAYITIADQFRPGPHEFDCQTTWTEQDCIDAINQKFL